MISHRFALATALCLAFSANAFAVDHLQQLKDMTEDYLKLGQEASIIDKRQKSRELVRMLFVWSAFPDAAQKADFPLYREYFKYIDGISEKYPEGSFDVVEMAELFWEENFRNDLDRARQAQVENSKEFVGWGGTAISLLAALGGASARRYVKLKATLERFRLIPHNSLGANVAASWIGGEIVGRWSAQAAQTLGYGPRGIPPAPASLVELGVPVGDRLQNGNGLVQEISSLMLGFMAIDVVNAGAGAVSAHFMPCFGPVQALGWMSRSKIRPFLARAVDHSLSLGRFVAKNTFFIVEANVLLPLVDKGVDSFYGYFRKNPVRLEYLKEMQKRHARVEKLRTEFAAAKDIEDKKQIKNRLYEELKLFANSGLLLAAFNEGFMPKDFILELGKYQSYVQMNADSPNPDIDAAYLSDANPVERSLQLINSKQEALFYDRWYRIKAVMEIIDPQLSDAQYAKIEEAFEAKKDKLSAIDQHFKKLNQQILAMKKEERSRLEDKHIKAQTRLEELWKSGEKIMVPGNYPEDSQLLRFGIAAELRSAAREVGALISENEKSDWQDLTEKTETLIDTRLVAKALNKKE